MTLTEKFFALAASLLGLGAVSYMIKRRSQPPTLPTTPGLPPAPPASAQVTVLTKHLSDSFLRAVIHMGDDFRAKGSNLSGEDFMAVFLAEASTFPWAKNNLGYAGLNAMGANERKAVGFTGTIDDWIKLSADEQLPYVRRFFEGNTRDFAKGDYRALTGYGKLYLMNFTPAYLLKPDDYVISRRGQPIYENNKGVDAGSKGYIEVADMGRFVERRLSQEPARWNEIRARMAALQSVA